MSLPNSTLIPTPDGYKRIGSIQVGDYIFNAMGKPTRVLGVYPQGRQKVWEITLADGRAAKCSGDHLWSYNTVNQKKESLYTRKFMFKTSQELAEYLGTESHLINKHNQKHGWKISLPQQYIVRYPERKVHIKPYTFGLLMEIGGIKTDAKTGKYYINAKYEEYMKLIQEDMGWTYSRKGTDDHNYYIDNYEDWLPQAVEKYNPYWKDNFQSYIPDSYLYGSVEQRLELVRGIFDSPSGNTTRDGIIRYGTNSMTMFEQIVDLVQGLGLSYGTYTKREKFFSIMINCHPIRKLTLVKLQRKRDYLQEYYDKKKDTFKPTSYSLVGVEAARQLPYSEEMTTFYITDKEQLILMNDYIVTHI